MTSPTPTGTIGDGPRGQELQLIRRFPDPIDDVWAAMTESDQLERWIGRWEGDPRSGRVTFFMTAEGDVPPEEYRIVECAPPHRFSGSTRVGQDTWRLRFELTHDDGVTTLLFAQLLGGDDIGSIGPGWEYYLDRLSRVLDDADAADIDWDDYYPAMREYYTELSG
ncbi:SRPBCC domain-containing protein [Lysobacter korlensis]|uniref:SRPBCC domain-containing protein n=1 Tax=Lysobacter korlensis TaxID=553636 RepID=A0ABV6RW06_9GAMM